MKFPLPLHCKVKAKRQKAVHDRKYDAYFQVIPKFTFIVESKDSIVNVVFIKLEQLPEIFFENLDYIVPHDWINCSKIQTEVI